MNLRRSALVLCIVLGTAAIAAAQSNQFDWSMTRYDVSQSGFTPQQVDVPMSLCWQYNTTSFDNNLSTPAVAGGVVYFATGNRVYAVDVPTGSLKWKFPSTSPMTPTIKTGITVWDGLVLFGGTDGNLYALTAADGRAAWTYQTGAPIRSTPIVSDGIAYFGSDDDSLYAIDAKTGQPVWSGGFRTKDDVQSTPAIGPETVVFVSMDTNVYGTNPLTGRMRWSFRLPLSAVRCTPVVAGNLVYVGSGPSLHVLSLKNGQLRYSINLPSDIAAAPAAVGGDVYVVCRNKKLYSYTVGMAGYKLRWAEPATIGVTTKTPPIVAGKTVFVGSDNGVVSAYSTDDGKLLWRYNVAPAPPGPSERPSQFTDISTSVVVGDGALFVLADDGAMRCFRPQAADNTAPGIFSTAPAEGAAMSGSPPIRISALLFDESTGVDGSSIQVLLDGTRVEHNYDPATLVVTYQTPITKPIKPLQPDGRHLIEMKAKDWKGNELDYSWSFIVDNSLPAPVIPKGTTARTGRDSQPSATAGGIPTPPTYSSGSRGPIRRTRSGGSTYPAGGPPAPPESSGSPFGETPSGGTVPPAPPGGSSGPPAPPAVN